MLWIHGLQNYGLATIAKPGTLTAWCRHYDTDIFSDEPDLRFACWFMVLL